MFKFLKSEAIKFKSSSSLYLILGYAFLEVLTIPIFLLFRSTESAFEIAMYLPMMANCLLATLISISIFDEEEGANHFQYLKMQERKCSIWSAKIILLDLFYLLPSVCLWFINGLITSLVRYCLFIGIISWLFFLLLNHLHLLLAFFVGRWGNMIIAFLESLFILFASNKVFLGQYWCPQILPVNILLTGQSLDNLSLICLLVWIVILHFLNLICLKFFNLKLK